MESPLGPKEIANEFGLFLLVEEFANETDKVVFTCRLICLFTATAKAQ